MFDWMMPLYKYLGGASYPRLSTTVAFLVDGTVFGVFWWITGREYRDQHPTTVQTEMALPSQPAERYPARDTIEGEKETREERVGRLAVHVRSCALESGPGLFKADDLKKCLQPDEQLLLADVMHKLEVQGFAERQNLREAGGPWWTIH